MTQPLLLKLPVDYEPAISEPAMTVASVGPLARWFGPSDWPTVTIISKAAADNLYFGAI